MVDKINYIETINLENQKRSLEIFAHELQFTRASYNFEIEVILIFIREIVFWIFFVLILHKILNMKLICKIIFI